MKTKLLSAMVLVLACGLHAADTTDEKNPIQVKVDRVDGSNTAKVTVDVTVNTPADGRRDLEERSGVLVVRSSGKDAQSFAAVIAPKIAAAASAGTGIAISPSELGEQGESKQIAEARTRGASYLIEINVTSFSSSEVALFGQQSRRQSANIAWRVLDITANNAAIGSGQLSDSSVSDTVIGADEQTNGLSDQMAAKVSEAITAKFASTKGKQALDIPVQIHILADELSFPNVTVDENHVVRRTKDTLGVELVGFTLTCDGVVMGTVPGASATRLPRGIRTISLERPGFEPWQGRVNVRDGLVIEPVIRPTAESVARWRTQIAFVQSLTDGAKLTDAETEKVRAAAQSLRNSGFKTNLDVKVDAKDVQSLTLPSNKR